MKEFSKDKKQDFVIEFTKWERWTKRDVLENVNSQGVYLLAHFDVGKVPTGSASPLDPKIIYFGETHDQNFKKRWRQFERSASAGERGHAGGLTYFEKFGGIKEELHVAFFPVLIYGQNKRLRNFFIYWLEAKLIYEFVLKFDNDKLCNKH